MTDDGKLNLELHEAGKARTVLDDETFDLAWKTVKANLLDELLNCPYRDKEGREYLWISLKALDSVVGQLRSMVDTGPMAEHQLNSLHK